MRARAFCRRDRHSDGFKGGGKKARKARDSREAANSLVARRQLIRAKEGKVFGIDF